RWHIACSCHPDNELVKSVAMRNLFLLLVILSITLFACNKEDIWDGRDDARTGKMMIQGRTSNFVDTVIIPIQPKPDTLRR
ncbi:MAG TPA: hypothetical protein VFQ58_08105, partial [Flavisolibacter sp.]|nr:hypothetical protein [Flavisolibacter sp.]